MTDTPTTARAAPVIADPATVTAPTARTPGDEPDLAPTLSRFTPSLMPPALLECVFVQRHDLAAILVAGVRSAARGKEPYHALLVGPRGIGKTFLLSLLRARLLVDRGVRDALAVAWLREDEWGVTSFADLVRRVARAIAADLDARDPAGAPGRADAAARLAEARDADLDADARAMLAALAGDRHVVILVENLDEIFAGLRRGGQHPLRALAQESGLSIVATTTALFRDVQDYEAPFFGSFAIVPLDELTVDDAVDLLARLARLNRDTTLATFVHTPNGRARVRAVHHLAGGNHRVYIMLAQFLTRERLDALVEPFLRLLDELTPYYQAQMYALSPQQRKLVDVLSEARGAIAVRELAARAGLPQQVTSSQLHVLRGRRVVHLTEVGRERFYEIREPLFRMTLEVRRQRGGPVEALVEFLRHWYSHAELADALEGSAGATVAAAALRTALGVALDGQLHEVVGAADNAGTTSRGRRRGARLDARKSSDEAAEPADPRARIVAAELRRCLEGGRVVEAARVADELASLAGDPLAWQVAGTLRHVAGDVAGAVDAYHEALRMAPDDPDVMLGLGVALLDAGRYADALEIGDRLASAPPTSARSVSDRTGPNRTAPGGRGTAGGPMPVPVLRSRALVGLDRAEEALALARDAYAEPPRDPEVGTMYVLLLLHTGRHAEALRVADACLAHAPDVPWLWLARGHALSGLAAPLLLADPDGGSPADDVRGHVSGPSPTRPRRVAGHGAGRQGAHRGLRASPHASHPALPDGGWARVGHLADRSRDAIREYRDTLGAAVDAYQRARDGMVAPFATAGRATAWLGEGDAWRALGNAPAAAAAYRGALDEDPADPRARHGLAEALLEDGEFEAALRAVDARPEVARAHGPSLHGELSSAPAREPPSGEGGRDAPPTLGWARARALAGLGRWEEFTYALDAQFGACDAAADAADLARAACEVRATALVGGIARDLILRRPGDVLRWRDALARLAAACRRHGFAESLSVGAVAGSAVLLDARVSPATAKAWVDACRDVLGDETLALAVRLIRALAAVAIEPADERILLRLSPEERRVVESLVTTLAAFRGASVLRSSA